MLEKLKAWRDVADEYNSKEVPTNEDMEAYERTDNAFTEAKKEWEQYLRRLNQPSERGK